MDSTNPLSALGRPHRFASICKYPPPETSPMAEATCRNHADPAGFLPPDPHSGPRIQGPTTALNLLRSNEYIIFDRLRPGRPADRFCVEHEPWLAAKPRCVGSGIQRPSVGSCEGQTPSVLFETAWRVPPRVPRSPPQTSPRVSCLDGIARRLPIMRLHVACASIDAGVLAKVSVA